jgi:ribosome-associated translation inhibitor RaiA
MQYTLNVRNLRLQEKDIEMIDTRIGLTLSRFANLITASEITLKADSADADGRSVHCNIMLNLQSGPTIEISDDARSVEMAITQALQRSKRSIERHLRFLRGPRLGSSITTRT